jgi:hypothetical protein
MYRPTSRRVAVAGALALMAAAPLAACGVDALAPLSVQAAPATSASPTPSAPPSTATRPGNSPPPAVGKPARTTTRPTRPPTTKPTSTCYGAVRHDLDLQNTELALVRAMCFRVGGVLRLQGIGPGLVTWEPAALVSHNYEAGVVDLRFIQTGTVVVSIPKDGQTYPITVVVIR